MGDFLQFVGLVACVVGGATVLTGLFWLVQTTIETRDRLERVEAHRREWARIIEDKINGKA